MTDKEIIQAQRICFRDLDDGAACPNCPLYGNENCLAEVMGGAVDLLERLSGANAHLYEELEWKDKVIALAQKEQAKAEAERDALREKVPQWVSVKDRLPDCAVPVLVTYIGYDGNRHGDDVATRIDDWWLWWDGDLRSSDERVTVKITHWMPLAEAPEEGEKEDA